MQFIIEVAILATLYHLSKAADCQINNNFYAVCLFGYRDNKIYLLNSSTQYPEAYKTAVAASSSDRPPPDEEDEEFKPSQAQPISKMVATVSTETLKPTTSDTKKSKKKEIKEST